MQYCAQIGNSFSLHRCPTNPGFNLHKSSGGDFIIIKIRCAKWTILIYNTWCWFYNSLIFRVVEYMNSWLFDRHINQLSIVRSKSENWNKMTHRNLCWHSNDYLPALVDQYNSRHRLIFNHFSIVYFSIFKMVTRLTDSSYHPPEFKNCCLIRNPWESGLYVVCVGLVHSWSVGQLQAFSF